MRILGQKTPDSHSDVKSHGRTNHTTTNPAIHLLNHRVTTKMSASDLYSGTALAVNTLALVNSTCNRFDSSNLKPNVKSIISQM